MVATDRKSALIAPVGVFIVVAYFRRHQLASLAPLGIVLVVVAIVLSPAAIRHVVTQFTSADATGVATVSSRTANYDAVRPDLWTHLLLGRGQGTYAPPTDRIVDSEVILRLVETGVLGLVAFLLIPIAVIVVARKTASRPDSRYSAAALTGLAAAVAFIISAVLYSVMSLPHGPDVFLYVAGLAVVASGAMDRPPDPRDHELDAPAYAELELLPVRARTERAIPAG
jgi:O-antigen ligase